MRRMIWGALAALALAGAGAIGVQSIAGNSPVPTQRGGGAPYEVLGTAVHDLPDPARGIPYQVFVSLPPSYADNPDRRYPVVYVTDADYGFPMLRLIGRRMNGAGPRVEEFILVGLSYATGEDSMASRRRDYTPTPRGASDAPAGSVHGDALAYRDYLRTTVIPFVEGQYRAQQGQRVYVGHSYGGLLGAQILLTQPEMFDGYVLGSPSFWFDRKHLIREMPALLARQGAIDAGVYLYVGEFEAQRVGDRRYLQEVDMVEDNRRFAELLEGRAYPALRLKAEVLEDEDHLSVAPRGFTRGLLHLLPAARGGQ